MNVCIQVSILAMLVMYGEADDGVTFLPTLSRDETLKIADCIGNSQDQSICDAAAACRTKNAPQVLAAFKKCNKEYNPSGNTKCDENTNLYSSPDTVSKIYDCMGQNIVPLTDAENKQMLEYEACFKDVYEKCKALPKNQ